MASCVLTMSYPTFGGLSWASTGKTELLTRRLIECLVGEAVYLEKFAAVKVVRGTEVRPGEKLTAFPALGRHIAHLFAPGGR